MKTDTALFAVVILASSVSSALTADPRLPAFSFLPDAAPPAVQRPQNPLSVFTPGDPVLTLANLGTTYELPPVTVQGQKPATSELVEEQRVGSYNQPRWTTQRRFPTTRVYVIPEGAVEVEFWCRPTFKKDRTTDVRFLYEVEIGLPNRFQLDLYFRTDQNTFDNRVMSGAQFELRYAFADWGVIPGNLTLYLEYVQLEDRSNRVEGRLLLGDELAPRWHWGVNIDWEQEIGRASRGEGEHELEFNGSLAYSLIDNYLSVGVESIFNFNNVRENRSAWNTEIYVGPSIQWRPIPHLAINFAPLAGVSEQAGYMQIYFNAGWQF